jgi:hypothetical protein
MVQDSRSDTGEFRKRLTVSKQRWYRLPMDRFNLKQLNAVEVKEQFRTEISNWFAALEV